MSQKQLDTGIAYIVYVSSIELSLVITNAQDVGDRSAKALIMSLLMTIEARYWHRCDLRRKTSHDVYPVAKHPVKLDVWQCPARARPARRLANANQAVVSCVDYWRQLANMIKPKCVANRSM